MKAIKNKLSGMSDERIAELQNFKTKDFADCPIQTMEQLKEFTPRYSAAQLCKLSKNGNISSAK
jgi:hypothetical protein